MLLKDNDIKGAWGTTNGVNNYASKSSLSQASADQDNAWFNQYFGSLEQQYGLSQQDLVKYFQQSGNDPQAQKMLAGAQSYAAQMRYPDQWYDKLASALALTGTVGVATAGFGSALAPAASAAVSGAVGGTAGAVAGGATAGAIYGGLGSALGNLATKGGHGILSATGKGVLTGAVGGGIGAGVNAAGLTGVQGQVASGALRGAAGAGLNGGNVGAGILQGAGNAAVNGAINAGTGAVAGSIFSNNNTVNQGLTNNMAASTTYGSDDGLDYITPGGSYMGQAGGNDYGFDPSTLGNFSPDTQNYLTNSLHNSTAVGGDYYNSLINSLNGYSGNGSSGAGGSIASKLLSSLLGGGGGQAGGSNSLLSSLLGGGLNIGAGVLNSNAAKSAASNFQQQNQYKPYSVTGANGSTSFNGTSAQQSLSPQAQQQYNQLGQLANTSANSLQAGGTAAASNYYNQLQASQANANNKYFQNNLDSQFGKGVLGSTAGQYQSQAALDNISQQGLNDQVLANQFGQNQQQQQLANLTASLNGQNQYATQQNQQLGLGGQLGQIAGSQNYNANMPNLYAQSNSTFGNALGSLGNSGASNGISSIISQLYGGQS